ncbi:hypothetical protein [Halorussus salinisoli]|uniref:hypothetical protein n=1 Tax=Halorussus salinisoli TaxID=2558242 RepID=UPI0010C20401|nr:hypothetical protein [Halorussus salinisoli]
MVESPFTYLKGIGLLLALFFVFYPVVLVLQLLTGTVTESIGQIAVLLVSSLIAWVWLIRLYRAYGSVDVTTKATE